MKSADQTLTNDQKERQRWMGLMAKTEPRILQEFWNSLESPPSFEKLRGPEQGLVMVRGRTGGSGAPFNLGEVTITRCSIRLEDGAVGHSYVSGRNKSKAEIAAVIDAMMQAGEQSFIEQNLLIPLEQAEAGRKREQGQKSAATRVEFFTLVRGED